MPPINLVMCRVILRSLIIKTDSFLFSFKLSLKLFLDLYLKLSQKITLKLTLNLTLKLTQKLSLKLSLKLPHSTSENVISIGQWAANIRKLANDVSLPETSVPISSFNHLTNDQLTPICQKGANISWPISSWCWLANEQLALVGPWAADVSWPMSS